MKTFKRLHFRVLLDEISRLGEMVENSSLRVPHAEEVQRVSTLAVLKIKVCIYPFHEDFQEIRRREAHQKVLDSPFFVVLVLFIHSWLRNHEFWVSSQLHQVVYCFY